MSLVAVANALKRQREEHTEWERRRAEERKREAEEAARRARVRGGKQKRSRARPFMGTRRFASGRLRKTSLDGGQGGVPEEQKQDIRTMAEWAMRHARFVDPFTHLAWMIGQFKNPPWSYGH